jgi:enterochelin esterase-like enzyme
MRLKTGTMICGVLIASVTFAALTTEPAALSDGDFTIKPPYADATELKVTAGIPHGTVHQFVMKSQDSRIYPGISKTQPGAVVPYERKVAVYVPAQYVADSMAPFIIVQDGMSYVKSTVPVLDNLIDQKRVPVMIAVFINSGGGDAQGSERGLEYDTLSGKYSDFIETEVLPKISRDFNVNFTTDPEGRATMGGSSGAACAFTMAWFHPELYRRVLSYSGTFVNQQSPENPQSPRGAWEYHASLIPNTKAKPIRVWLEVGENDNGFRKDEASLHNWVLANQRMAAALKAKGYHYQYTFAEGAGHVDRKVVGQTLPEALEWLWQRYGQKQ